MKTTISVICFLLLAGIPLQAQHPQMASTIQVDVDTVGSETIRNIAYAMRISNNDSAQKLFKLALEKDLSTRDSVGVLKTVTDLANAMQMVGSVDSAIVYLDKGLAFADNLNDRSVIRHLYMYGNVYGYSENFDKSIEFYQKAEVESIHQQDSSLLPDIYYKLANQWNAHSDDEERILDYYEKANTLAQSYSSSFYQYIYLYSTTEAMLNRFPESHGLNYLNRFITMHRSRYPDLGKKENHIQIADLLNEERDDIETLRSKYNRGIKAARQLGFHVIEAAYLISLSETYEDEVAGIIHLQKALELSRTKDDYFTESQLLQLISGKFETAGNFADALRFHKMYQILADSVNNLEKQKAIEGLREKYESEKKELEIASLGQENLFERTINKQRTAQRNWLIAGIVLLFLLSGFILSFFRQRLKNSQLEASVAESRITELEQQQKILTMNSMIEGQENERRRIARDLHDGLGGILTTIKMHFSNIQQELTKLDELHMVKKTGSLIEYANSEVRKIAHEMMPGSLVKLGLTDALEDLCTRNSMEGKLDVHFEKLNMDYRLSETAEVMLFRVAQELLNNIQKHSEASEVILQLSDTGEQIEMVVEDNGKGFNPDLIDTTTSMGLRSIKSRISFLNGTTIIESTLGTGTTISVYIPKNEHVS
jgi:signal transduction histidine kinase